MPVLNVQDAIDILFASLVLAWQKQSQTECVFGETNKELRKYKYGVVRSHHHNMTHATYTCMFNACVGSRLLEHEPSQTSQNAVMRRCHPLFFIPLPPNAIRRCSCGRPADWLRLRLHVSRYPDIWISGCQRSGYLRSVYTCRIETFSAFTRLQISGCIVRGILALCRRNTQMLFFGQVACLQTLFHFFPFFLLMFVGWTTRSKFCLVSSVIDYKRQR